MGSNIITIVQLLSILSCQWSLLSRQSGQHSYHWQPQLTDNFPDTPLYCCQNSDGPERRCSPELHTSRYQQFCSTSKVSILVLDWKQYGHFKKCHCRSDISYFVILWEYKMNHNYNNTVLLFCSRSMNSLNPMAITSSLYPIETPIQPTQLVVFWFSVIHLLLVTGFLWETVLVDVS